MSDTVPTWVDGSGGGTPLSAANLNLGSVAIRHLQLNPTAVKTANYTAVNADFVPCNISGGSFTVTLPTAPTDSTNIGVAVVTVGFGNTLTVACGGSDVINKAGTTSTTLTNQNETIVLRYNSSAAIWYVIEQGQRASMLGRIFRLGPTEYAATVPSGSTTGAYLLLDKVNTVDDASLLLRQAGVQKAEIGLAADNDLHLKATTGADDAHLTFTDGIIVYNATGYVNVPQRLGVGTVPAELVHVAAANTAARTLVKIENTAAVSGGNSGSAGVYMVGQGHTWNFISDVGENGGDNFAIQSDTAGFEPLIFCDSSRNVAVNGSGGFGGGTGVVFIANATAAPASDPTGGGILYCDAGALKFRGSSGTVTTIAPA